MHENAWYECWFDSPWYPVLYRDRDDAEAAAFIEVLLGQLALPPGSRALDLACGRGRHARMLHRGGLEVTGVDLSPKSIDDAKKFEAPGLEFFVHDMRRPFRIHYYDAVFNLFTSFGYFDTERDNARTVSAVASMLRPEGIFVIDFFNASPVAAKLAEGPYRDEKTIDGITFHIEKYSTGTHVIKNIRFEAGGEEKQFTEKVQLLKLADFRRLLEKAFTITGTFGNYALAPFDEERSDRLIIVAKKKTV